MVVTGSLSDWGGHELLALQGTFQITTNHEKSSSGPPYYYKTLVLGPQEWPRLSPLDRQRQRAYYSLVWWGLYSPKISPQ